MLRKWHTVAALSIAIGTILIWRVLGQALDLTPLNTLIGTIGTLMVIVGTGAVNEAMIKDYTSREKQDT